MNDPMWLDMVGY